MFLLFVPAFALFLIFQVLARRREDPWDWRASVMMASVAWACLVVALTELLNLGRRLDAPSLALEWGVILVALLGLLGCLVSRAGYGLPKFAHWRSNLWRWMREQGLLNWVLFAVLAVQAVALAVVALSYAPNAFESMRYHLPRVMHWLQDGSLAPFASSNVRENYFPPFAEYVFLHLIALTGGDYYVNLVQVGAFLLCLVGVSALAEQLGADRKTQIAASVLAAGVPLAVLQATSPRNDLIVALWLISLTWFGLRWAAQPASPLWLVMTGLSLGLALLTKATGFVYAAPLGVMIGAAALRNGGFRLGLTRGLLALVLAGALNSAHVLRNWALYGSPRGAWGRVGTEVTTPATVASTAIRNVAVHVPTNCRPPLNILDGAGKVVLGWLGALHALTGQDPIDPGTTWGIRNIFEGAQGCVYDEQEGGNALHALLILVTAFALPFMRSVSARAKWLALALFAAFVLLSLFVRWQIWAGYLQTPLFILWAPLVALTLAQVRWLHLARLVALVALLLSFFWICNNRLRPLSRVMDGSIPPRDQQYFSYYMEAFTYPQYRSAARLVAQSGCERVGLKIESPVLEYPFWVLLRREGFTGQVQHVDVNNELSVYEDPGFDPCAVISQAASSQYAAALQEQALGPFYLYLRRTTAPP